MKVLIDGDIPRYECGFAAETPVWEVRDTVHDELIASFRYKKELDEFVGTMGFKPEEVNIVNRKDIGPVSHALHNVKELLRLILERTRADDYQIYITGKGNYREDIATILPYKGNRDSSHKPYHYDSITRYLIENWEAEEVHGIEADDALAIAQYQDFRKCHEAVVSYKFNTCIASIDKDLDMVPGLHYNWRKDVLYFIDEWTADTWFYCQLIIGDKSVDNIQGIPGKGPVAAKKILWDCDTNKERYEAVLKAYTEYVKKEGRPEEEAEKELLENARLLWMLREPLNKDRSNMWSPPE